MDPGAWAFSFADWVAAPHADGCVLGGCGDDCWVGDLRTFTRAQATEEARWMRELRRAA